MKKLILLLKPKKTNYYHVPPDVFMELQKGQA